MSNFIDFIVKKTVDFKLGARGLRAIVEAIMKDVMFELPSKNVKSYRVKLDYAKQQVEKSESLAAPALNAAD